MVVAKQVADWITFARLGIGILLVFLGISQGEAVLPLVIWLMLIDWVGDFLDGNLARRSRIRYKSWIGEHDLHVDMTVATGLLLYFISSRILSPCRGWLYLVVWGVIFVWLGVPSSLGMLYQAPIYGYLLWVSLTGYPALGWWLVAYLVAVIVLTWPKFPKQVVPGFLYGLREIRLPKTRKG